MNVLKPLKGTQQFRLTDIRYVKKEDDLGEAYDPELHDHPNAPELLLDINLQAPGLQRQTALPSAKQKNQSFRGGKSSPSTFQKASVQK